MIKNAITIQAKMIAKIPTGPLIIDLPSSQEVAQVALAAVARAPQRGVGWHMVRVTIKPEELLQLTGFMRQCGFPVILPAAGTRSKMLVEVHTAVAASTGDPLPPCLVIHKDDQAGLSADVHTLLVYCTGSVIGGVPGGVPGGVTGGELDIYGEEEPLAGALPSYTIDTRPAADCVRAVLMSGRLWHCPRAIAGAGAVRQVFVFQCERAPECEPKPERSINP